MSLKRVYPGPIVTNAVPEQEHASSKIPMAVVSPRLFLEHPAVARGSAGIDHAACKHEGLLGWLA